LDNRHIIIIIIIISHSLFTDLSWYFSSWNSGEPTTQVSDCSTFLITGDCFQIFFLVTIPVAPMITGVTKLFMFHIRWISVLKFLYFNFFRAPSVLHSYPMVLLHVSVSQFYIFCFNYYVGPICQNLPISLYPLIPQYCYIFMLTCRLRYVGVPVFCSFNA
jgi:hypothetical protein